MSTPIEVPSASADPILHADCIELSALLSKSESGSLEGYARDMRISTTTDAQSDLDFDEDPGDWGGEQSKAVATDAWSEIERRAENCGGDHGHYPFEVSEFQISLKSGWHSSPYVFQLLLGEFGHKASTKPMNGASLFEKLSSEAARKYLGGKGSGAMARPFGFPRADGTNFRDALQELCSTMGEGVVNTSAPQIANQKDSHLDVVAWLPFRDRRSAQLIAFGQCSTGEQWGAKLYELEPGSFRDKWLGEGFAVEPIRMFFVPRSIEEARWGNAAIDGGIIFDRCRISWCVGKPNGDLAKELAAWSKSVRASHMG